ncbi:Mu transposase C-terminal domain-containing protein [Sphingomonas sp. LB2R24]|uniref:Mu transposase C-terminal domain-containing protein n=1 Tax=Sphingomonas sorbitolis TaxID=3096165 RepID=UPI002FC9B828
MNLQPHDIILTGNEPPRLKVLWVGAEVIFVKDADKPKEYPHSVDLVDVADMVESGAWTIQTGMMPVYPPDDKLTDAQLAKRVANWSVVKPLVTTHVPSIFIKRHRVTLVTETAQRLGLSERWIKTLLLRAFDGGMVRGSTDSKLENCGAKGEDRPARDGDPKRGRTVVYGAKSGKNVTEDMKRMFLISADEWERKSKIDMPAAYRRCMRMFFSEIVEELHSVWPKYIPTGEYEAAGLPRFEQFVYHVKRNRDRIESERRRLGARKWDMKNRALLSDSNIEAWGPGARFQIDATIIDVYLRSRRNRRKLMRRATLYVVIDVFSRMIVGFSLSLDPPSWQAAMTALANAVTDKVAFCAKYGISIIPEEWPCNHICGILEGDRGEIESQKILGAIERFNISVENAAAYRADWKGIVESRFRILQVDWKPYVEGYIDTDYQERGGRDYRLDAVLDIDDLTRIIIRQILYFNNHHELKKYQRDSGMTEDKVPSVPREIWNWGIGNIGGLPRAPKEELFLFALLPTAEASVTPFGISYHGNHYTCPYAVKKRWFEKARKKRFKVTISYDKRDVDLIYVHIDGEPNGYEVAQLTPTSRRRLGWDGWEVEDDIREVNHVSADRRDEQTMKRVGMESKNESEVGEAKAKYDALPNKDRNSEQTSDLRAKTAVERELDRADDVAEYQTKMGVRKPGTNVEPVVAPTSLSENASRMSEADTFPEVSKKPHAKPTMRDMMKAAGRSK